MSNILKRPADGPCVRICASCPWIKANHGKKHPAKWYTMANLRRLWRGLRTGDAPGMVCHSSDPEAPSYGSTLPIKETAEKHACGGSIALLIREMNLFQTIITRGGDYREYKAMRGPNAVTKGAMAEFLWNNMMGAYPPVEDYRIEDIGLPGEI